MELQLCLCELSVDGFIAMVKDQLAVGKGLTESYLAVEEFHKETFGKNRYSGFETFQRTWYRKK